MDNEQLAARVKDGDQEALFSLWKQNQGVINRICRIEAADDEEFQDLKQESYFYLIKAIEGFLPELGFKFTTYLTKTLHRNIWRYKRYCRCKEALTLNVPLYDGREDERIDEIIDPDTPDPLERIEREFLIKQLNEAINRLPERQADMINQHYLHGSSIKDLANIFQTTVRDIQHNLVYGKSKLRRDRFLVKTWRYWTGYYWDSEAYQSSGLRSFRNTRTSSTERIALNNIWTEEKILSFLSRMKEGEVS